MDCMDYQFSSLNIKKKCCTTVFTYKYGTAYKRSTIRYPKSRKIFQLFKLWKPLNYPLTKALERDVVPATRFVFTKFNRCDLFELRLKPAKVIKNNAFAIRLAQNKPIYYYYIELLCRFL